VYYSLIIATLNSLQRNALVIDKYINPMNVFILIVISVSIVVFYLRNNVLKLKVIESLSKIVGLIAIPIIITIIGGNIQENVVRIQQQVDWQKHDLSILQEFQKLYFDDDKRGLSLHYVNLIHDNQTSVQLRRFIIWNTLNRNIMIKQNTGKSSFKFDTNVIDWHYLGENIESLFKLNKDSITYYKKVKKIAPNTFKDYGSAIEVNAIFHWLEESYPDIGNNVK
jgi:hypothetical protein